VGGCLEEKIDLLMIDVEFFWFATNYLAPLDSILSGTKFESNFLWKLRINSGNSSCCYYQQSLLLSSNSKHYCSFFLSNINIKLHLWTLFFLWVILGSNQVFSYQHLMRDWYSLWLVETYQVCTSSQTMGVQTLATVKLDPREKKRNLGSKCSTVVIIH